MNGYRFLNFNSVSLLVGFFCTLDTSFLIPLNQMQALDTDIDIERVTESDHRGFVRKFDEQAWDCINGIQGMALRNVPGKGNCGYLCMSWLIFGAPKYARVLRHLMADFLDVDRHLNLVMASPESKTVILDVMRQQWAEQKNLDGLVKQPETFEQALEMMLCPLVDLPVDLIGVFAHIFGCRILVVTPQLRSKPLASAPKTVEPRPLIDVIRSGYQVQKLSANFIQIEGKDPLFLAKWLASHHDAGFKYGHLQLARTASTSRKFL
jgi:hypothetical protein